MNLKKKNIIFIFTFVCLNLLSFLVFRYYKEQINIQQISNNSYSSHSIRIEEKYLFNNEKFISDDLRVFLEFNDNIRIVYKVSRNWSPKIKTGRFFEENEKGNKAVIGNEYIESLKQINGKNYISMFGIDFEVIGIMQEDFVSKLDSLLFLKAEVIPDFDIKSVVIDSDYKIAINKFIAKIKKENNSINIIKTELDGLNKSIKSDFFNKLIIISTILLIFFSIIVFIRYWFEINISFFYTQFLLGISYRKIKVMFVENIIFNIFISNLISAFFMFKSDIKFIIITLISSLFISSSAAILLMNNWIKCNNIKRGEVRTYVKRT